MAKIKFIYEKNIYKMTVKYSNSIGEIIKKYLKLLFVEKEDLLFLYKGINIFQNRDILNKLTKNNITIVVINKNNDKNNEKEIENIICPECKNLAFAIVNEDRININCVNKHKIEYAINDFINKEKITEKCHLCNNNKYLYKNNFYICSCNKYILRQIVIAKDVLPLDLNLIMKLFIKLNKKYFLINKYEEFG